MPAGRPTKLTDELKRKTIEYIEKEFEKDEVIPTIEGLAFYLKISRDSIHEYTQKDKEFSDLIEGLKTLQAKKLLSGSLKNKLNPTIAKLMLSKHGYKEGFEHDHTIELEL